jgi:RNA polymerase-binding transcription factor DksA
MLMFFQKTGCFMQRTQQEVQQQARVSGTIGINPALLEIRSWLVDYVTKSNLLSERRIHELREGDGGVPYRHPSPNDAASLAEIHTTSMAISEVVRVNVEKSLIIIRMIDEGWDGVCPKCQVLVPIARIKSAFSMLCSECIRDIKR